MIRSRSFALVDTESKVSACTHMPIVRYEDARFSKRDDSVIQEAELTVFVERRTAVRSRHVRLGMCASWSQATCSWRVLSRILSR